jgi:RNA polymerase sigma-32 factor
MHWACLNRTLAMLVETDPSLTRYKALVSQLPVLERDEELALARRFKASGDPVARDVLARSQLRTVVSIALKYRRYGIDLSELIAEGNVGLVHALSKFDPERGNRLVTYASHWIRAYILESVLKSWSIVGGGSGALRTKLFFKLRRERARVENLVGNGEEAERLLAQRLELEPEKLRVLLQQLEIRDLRLDAAASDGDSSVRLVDVLPSLDRNQEEIALRSEAAESARDKVGNALEALDERERFIVEQRFMADPEDQLSLAEIGRSLGFSRERARQLEARARRKLRARIVHLEHATRPEASRAA